MAEDTNAAPAAESDFAPTLPADTGALSPMDAARMLSKQRSEAQQPTEDKPQRDRDPTGRFVAKESTSQEDDAGPDDPVPGETAQDDPAELPPIDPPRSWSKEDKELFNSLPRETQERVADRERSRESDFLKRQNEATEKSKALEAKEQAAEQARQRHEQAATNALQVLQQQTAAEFSDIKSMDDVRKLAEADPFRFAQFQARQMQLQAQANEVERLNQQREKETQDRFKTWSAEQDSIFEKKFPEFADKEKVSGLRKGITDYLTSEVGVPAEALPKLWDTELFRDAMFQRVVYDASRFHAAQQKAKAAAQKPLPAPQRPGAASDKRDQHREAVDQARTNLKSAKGIRAVEAGLELLRAHRAARR